MPIMLNPLRFPGAKRQLIPYFEKLLDYNNLKGVSFFEPFAGSAVVGLELLKKGIISNLILIEKDVLIFSFWKCLFLFPELLCEKIDETDISVETWKELKHLRNVKSPNEMSLLDLGFAGLFFNRTNYSGIIKANPIGGLNQSSKYKINCRFNKKAIIDLILKLSKMEDEVQVFWDDALRFMNRKKNCFIKEKSFVYFDPPYFEKGKQLYRHYYEKNDHIKLAWFVQNNKIFDWLISYDDNDFICGLYNGTKNQYKPIFLDYSTYKNKREKGKELLISNLPLPPTEAILVRSS